MSKKDKNSNEMVYYTDDELLAFVREDYINKTRNLQHEKDILNNALPTISEELIVINNLLEQQKLMVIELEDEVKNGYNVGNKLINEKTVLDYYKWKYKYIKDKLSLLFTQINEYEKLIQFYSDVMIKETYENDLIRYRSMFNIE